MRREQLDLAQRRHAQLHARAADLERRSRAPRRCRRPRAAAPGSARGASRDARRPSPARGRAGPRPRRRDPGVGQPAQLDRRVAAARDPVVELDDRVRRRRAARPAGAPARRPRPRGRARPRSPAGASTPVCGEQPPAAGLRARAGAAAGRRRRAGCRAPARGRARASSSRTGSRWQRVRSGMRARIWARIRGRSSSLSASARGEPSCVATRCRRARAWLGMTPGSSAR